LNRLYHVKKGHQQTIQDLFAQIIACYTEEPVPKEVTLRLANIESAHESDEEMARRLQEEDQDDIPCSESDDVSRNRLMSYLDVASLSDLEEQLALPNELDFLKIK